jgi:hypothetical protein
MGLARPTTRAQDKAGSRHTGQRGQHRASLAKEAMKVWRDPVAADKEAETWTKAEGQRWGESPAGGRQP